MYKIIKLPQSQDFALGHSNTDSWEDLGIHWPLVQLQENTLLDDQDD
jgi:hypothetical protein